MLIIIDHRMPAPVMDNLRRLGEVVPFISSGSVYDAIEGHPDVFLCSMPHGLVVSPNAPEYVKERVKQHRIIMKTGVRDVGNEHPETVHYNAVATANFLIHNLNLTDKTILQSYNSENKIFVKQGYTRCNLIALDEEHFITSDKGIYSALAHRVKILYVSPEGIKLKNFDHGFIGGTAGVLGNTVFFAGSLNYFPEGEKVREFIEARRLKVVDLYDGPLIDGGGIFFLHGF